MNASVPLPLVLPLLLGACGEAPPERKAVDDARAVAQVEAMQKVQPPLQPVRLQPIDPAVRRLFNLGPGGCEFRDDRRPGARPVLVVGHAKAVLHIGDDPTILAADSGSPELRFGVRVKYTGRRHWAQLLTGPEVGGGRSEGQFILRDRYDRVVYSAAGTLTCAGSFAGL